MMDFGRRLKSRGRGDGAATHIRIARTLRTTGNGDGRFMIRTFGAQVYMETSRSDWA